MALRCSSNDDEEIMTDFDPANAPKVGLGTSTDLFIEILPRKAGIESGRVYNHWCTSTWRIFNNPAPVRTLTTGIAWEIDFKATDEPGIEQTFHGYAETRRHAKASVTDVITKHVSKISSERLNPRTHAALTNRDESTLVEPIRNKPLWWRVREWLRWQLRAIVDFVVQKITKKS